MKTLLITGTDTEVGKTIVTSSLIAYWRRYFPYRSLSVFKPIQTGVGDRQWYEQVFSLTQPPGTLNPLSFDAPLAPPIAAEREGRMVDLAPIWQTFLSLQQSSDWVFVEGLGGLGSPVTHELTVADLARDWRLPIVLVVPVRLGAIAQAVANVALAHQNRLKVLGILLNCCDPEAERAIVDWTPPDLIEALTHTRVLGYLPYLTDPTDVDSLVKAASGLMVDILFPGLMPTPANSVEMSK